MGAFDLEQHGRTARTAGNPNGGLDREAARLGQPRKPDDIPVQGKPSPVGYKPGNVDQATFRPSTAETRKYYRIGPAQRPHIEHDIGFLRFGKRAPTDDDYEQLHLWKLMLEGAESVRPDLSDALAAYRHFLEGRGVRRLFSYERYVNGDVSGRTTLRNAILEFQYAAVELALDHPDLRRFQFTGPAIPCGGDPGKYPDLSRRFPYPATENWQKAIGGHAIWISGTVEVDVDSVSERPKQFRGVMDLHAEDRYNFNPGADDIATGIPDSANGRFEVTGLAHQYENHGTLRRVLHWSGLELGVSLVAAPHTTSLRQPTENRRIRNRI